MKFRINDLHLRPKSAITKRLEQRHMYALTIVVLVIGIVIVNAFASSLSTLRWPMGNDGIGYIEEASNFLDGKGLVRTPWGAKPLDSDLIHSRSFPPGYPLLIAGVSKLGISPADAAAAISISAWILVPVAILYALSPLLGHWVAAMIGVIAVTSPSIYQFGFSPGTDVLFVVFAAVSIGLLIRSMQFDKTSYGRLLVCGAVVALMYATRNTGLAFYAAIGAAFLLAPALGILPVQESLKRVLLFGLGGLPILGALMAWNLTTFGSILPYQVFRGADISLLISMRVLLHAYLLDLTGIQQIAQVAWNYKILVLTGAPLCVWLTLSLARRWRVDPPMARFSILLFCLYILIGSIMVTIAHSYSGLDPYYLLRHVMPYAWLIPALIALAAIAPNRGAMRFRRIFIALVISAVAAGHVAYVWQYLDRQQIIQRAFKNEISVAMAASKLRDNEWILIDQIKMHLAMDQELIAAVRQLPNRSYLISNQGTFLGFITSRSVRNMPLGSIDQLGVFFEQLEDIVCLLDGNRPFFFIIIPDNQIARKSMAVDWQAKFVSAMPDGFHVEQQTTNGLIIGAQMCSAPPGKR